MKFLLGMLSLLLPFFSYAIILEPLVLEMTTDRQASIIISNPSSRNIAVDTNTLEIDFDKANTTTESNDVLIFPPAFVLKPGAKQRVRLIWNANKKMEQSRSFYIRFETPSLQSVRQANGSIMDVKIDYNALLHVSQKGQKANLQLTAKKNQNNKLVLDIANTGNSYAYLENYQITSSNSALSSDKLVSLLGNVFFPPFSKSKLTIPTSALPKNFDANKNISITK